MDINELFSIRKENLKRVVLDKFEGNKAAFSRHVGIHPNHVNLMYSSNPDIMRNMGEELARRIEVAVGLPLGWFDTRHDGATRTTTIRASKADQSISRAIVTCREIESITVSEFWLSKIEDKVTAVENLTLATVATKEMEPVLMQGQTVVIDAGVKSVTTDGIYLMTKADAGFLRQVRRTTEGTFASVANPEYSTGKPEVLKGMKAVGKVVSVISTSVM